MKYIITLILMLSASIAHASEIDPLWQPAAWMYAGTGAPAKPSSVVELGGAVQVDSVRLSLSDRVTNGDHDYAAMTVNVTEVAPFCEYLYASAKFQATISHRDGGFEGFTSLTAGLRLFGLPNPNTTAVWKLILPITVGKVTNGPWWGELGMLVSIDAFDRSIGIGVDINIVMINDRIYSINGGPDIRLWIERKKWLVRVGINYSTQGSKYYIALELR